MKSNLTQFSIKFDENKLSNNKSKSEYLLNLIKNSNPLMNKKQKITINDLLSCELQLLLQQKQTVCGKKTRQMKELCDQFDNLGHSISNQKELTCKYEEKIDIYLNKIQSQAKNQLHLLTKQRIQKEVEFAQRIDQKLQRLTSDLNRRRQLTQHKDQAQESQRFKQISVRVSSLKSKQQQLSISMTQNQKELLKLINTKVFELKGKLNQLKSSISKLDQLLDEVQEFQKLVISKIKKLKQQRTQKEQHFIEIIDKIISVVGTKDQ